MKNLGMSLLGYSSEFASMGSKASILGAGITIGAMVIGLGCKLTASKEKKEEE